jgi:ATP:cob(I)alamin adenosyltransferase
MSVYTRGGDHGQTSLRGGVRVPKDSLRIEVYGTLDEATSTLGLARATSKQDDICRLIIVLQGEFIDVMAELATGTYDETHPSKPSNGRPLRVEASQVARLEALIDGYETELIPSHHFVRPGGSVASAALDMARTIVRRAERRLVTMGGEDAVNPHLVSYLNRLSDLVYVMARIDEQRSIVDAVKQQLKDPTVAVRHHGGGMAALRLTDCDRMVEAGMRRAEAIAVAMVLTVVDAAGRLVELRRMDGALGISLTLAPNKAHTAAMLRLPTQELAKQAQPNAPLFGIDVNSPNITLIAGGLPLVQDGLVIGAVGVSGGAVEQDIDVAQAMASAF